MDDGDSPPPFNAKMLASFGVVAGLAVLAGGGLVLKDQIKAFLELFITLVDDWGPLGYAAYIAVYAALEVLAVPAIPLVRCCCPALPALQQLAADCWCCPQQLVACTAYAGVQFCSSRCACRIWQQLAWDFVDLPSGGLCWCSHPPASPCTGTPCFAAADDDGRRHLRNRAGHLRGVSCSHHRVHDRVPDSAVSQGVQAQRGLAAGRPVYKADRLPAPLPLPAVMWPVTGCSSTPRTTPSLQVGGCSTSWCQAPACKPPALPRSCCLTPLSACLCLFQPSTVPSARMDSASSCCCASRPCCRLPRPTTFVSCKTWVVLAGRLCAVTCIAGQQ